MLVGRMHQTAEGFNSYEISEAESGFVFTLASWIQPEFGLDAYEMPTFGLDNVFLHLWQGETAITLGWDHWSGCFVMSYSEAGDVLVQEIGAYLNGKLDTLNRGEN